MATYAELYDLITQESETKNRVAVAVTIAAETVRTEPPATTKHANRLIWAKQALSDPKSKAEEMWPALLAQNAGNTVAQITSASDAVIQASVDAAIDLFADGSA